jgi:hypothetical protein
VTSVYWRHGLRSVARHGFRSAFTLLREIAKRQRQLDELRARLLRHQKGEVRGGKRPTTAGVRKTIDGYLKARHMKELFEIQLDEHDGVPVLTSPRHRGPSGKT